jgi:D-alanyl-D-alanine carboxypeptidase
MLKRSLLTSVLLCIFMQVIVAQSVNKAKLDSLFDILAAKDKSMGSVAISQNGNIVYQRAIGYSAIFGTKNIPADQQTRYRIGSITKMFTGTMIFQLIQEGKLKLDTKLSVYYPQIPNADKITIGNLLNHHSGLHNFTNDPRIATYMYTPVTEEFMLSNLAAGKPDFEPGAKAEYSNTNFILLGYIIQKLTHKTYAEALKQRITARLGLKDTYYGGKIDPKNHEAHSYTLKDSWEQSRESDMSVPGGAGAIVSTPADLIKFIEALFSGKLINEENLNSMKTLKDGFGMALLKIPFYDKIIFGHNGRIDNFSSALGYAADEKITYAYLSNSDTYLPNGTLYPTNDVIIGILSICFDKPYTIPSFKTIELTSEDLNKYLGTFSSVQMPLKITFSKAGEVLMAQATGQPQFPLTPLDNDKFGYSTAALVVEFEADGTGFILRQAGGEFRFNKDK